MPEINYRSIDNAEDLNIVMPMYNLLECSYNYFMILGNLWNYYRNETNDDLNKDDAANSNNRINNNNTISIKSFEYKAEIR